MSFKLLTGTVLNFTAVTLFAAAISGPLHAAIIFEDTFDGSPTGGTRSLTNNSNVSNQIVNTNPFAGGSGSYLKTTPVNGAPSQQGIVTYNPTSIANSWESLAGTVNINNQNYTTLNGGFDVFFRPNSTDTISSRMDIHWLRPVDIDSTTQGFRLILEGNAAGSLALQLITNNGNAFGNSPGTWATGNRSLTVNNFYNQLTLGEAYHLGFTFSTNATTGLVTMSVYGTTGTGAIDTTATTHRLATTSFYINDDVARAGGDSIFGGLRSWSMVQRDADSIFNNVNIDYETVRMYSGQVTSFDALPVPEPGRALLLMLGAFFCINRRKRM